MPYQGLDQGWSWVVLTASCLSLVVIGGFGYTVGEVYTALLERYQASVVKTALVGSLHTALCTVAGPLSSFLIDNFSCRTAIMSSGVLISIGCLATAFASTIDACIFTFGVITGLGGGAGYAACLVVITFNFELRRNLGLGVALAGSGFGLFIIPPIIQVCKQNYGSSGMFIVLAGIALQLVVFGALCKPSELELESYNTRKRQSIGQNRSDQLRQRLAQYVSVSTNKHVLCVCLSMFTYCTGILIVFLYLPAYTLSKGYGGMTTALLMSSTGISAILGRILTGMVSNCDQVDDLLIFSGTMVITSVATFFFPLFSDTFAGQSAYYILFGAYHGSGLVLIGSIIIPYVGIEYNSAAVGLTMLFGGVGSLIGPTISGALLDRWKSFDPVLILAGTSLLLGGIFGLATRLFPNTNKSECIQEKIDLEVKANFIKERKPPNDCPSKEDNPFL